MSSVADRVYDDVVKTCSFLMSASAAYIALRSVENRVLGTDHLGNSPLGRMIGDFDESKKPKTVK